MKNVIYVLSLSFLASLSTTNVLADGSSGRGGGDPVEQDFATSAENGIRTLAPFAAKLGISMPVVQQAWDNATLAATNDELYDKKGRGPKVATSDPDQHLTEINRAKWNAIGLARRKGALALHEVLRLARLESDNYDYSAYVFGINPNAIDTDDPLALMVNGSNYRPLATKRHFPKWIHFEKGPGPYQLTVTDAKGDTFTYNCYLEGAFLGVINDNGPRNSYSNYNCAGGMSGAGENDSADWAEIRFMPNGNLNIKFESNPYFIWPTEVEYVRMEQ